MAEHAPKRIEIQYPAPIVDGGRFPAKRCVGDTVTASADVFRDGHDLLRAVVRYRGPNGKRWREAEMRRIDAHLEGVRWAGEFVVDKIGRWEYAIEAWTDCSAPGATSWSARSMPGSTTWPARCPRARCCCGRRPSRPRRRTIAPLIEHALRSSRRRTSRRVGQARRRPRSRAVRRRGAQPGTPRRACAAIRWRSRSTGSGPASAPGMSSSRARGAGSRGCSSSCPSWPSSASTSSTCRPSIPIGHTNRKGAQQRAQGRAQAIPAHRGRSATRPAATTRSTPSWERTRISSR